MRPTRGGYVCKDIYTCVGVGTDAQKDICTDIDTDSAIDIDVDEIQT